MIIVEKELTLKQAEMFLEEWKERHDLIHASKSKHRKNTSHEELHNDIKEMEQIINKLKGK